jgi:hypothetical protein
VINVLVTVTLIEMMAAIGLRVTFTDLSGVARNWRLVIRAALANYVCVAAATIGESGCGPSNWAGRTGT